MCVADTTDPPCVAFVSGGTVGGPGWCSLYQNYIPIPLACANAYETGVSGWKSYSMCGDSSNVAFTVTAPNPLFTTNNLTFQQGSGPQVITMNDYVTNTTNINCKIQKYKVKTLITGIT